MTRKKINAQITITAAYTAAGVKGGKIAPGFSRGVELHPLFQDIPLSTATL